MMQEYKDLVIQAKNDSKYGTVALETIQGLH